MNQQSLIESLKKEASKNEAANHVFSVWASRKRARSSVTVAALTARMVKEGFTHTPDQYESILKFLASTGLGTLETTPKGRVKGLKGIKMTLQSIGMAAVGKAPKLASLKQRNRFTTLPVVVEAEVAKKAAQPASGAVAGFPVAITVVINGKPVNFRIPKELDEREIADLVVRFRDKNAE